MQPLFKEYDIGCETAKRIWKTFITLPSHVDLIDEEVDYILNALENFQS
jgi:dTDP-4-amino-4,6-dideoxygalactose transaminase